MTFEIDISEICQILSTSVQPLWDGKSAIIEMKTCGYTNWKQMEWIGFYFQFLCEQKLSSIMNIPGPKYGNVSFDGFYKIPWDFKAHVNKDGRNDVIVNDREAIEMAFKQFGALGIIIACGEPIYDDGNRSFKNWHDELKGGKSNYECERIKRGASSRRRKTSFKIEEIKILTLKESSFPKFRGFQQGFRNADGSPRRLKLQVDLDLLNEEILQIIRF